MIESVIRDPVAGGGWPEFFIGCQFRSGCMTKDSPAGVSVDREREDWFVKGVRFFPWA